jgi:hypothetical protein
MMQESIVDVDPISFTFFELDNSIVNTLETLESKYTFFLIALQEYIMLLGLSVLFDDLGDWVKPKSTMWFSRFILIKFDENHCVMRICMASYMTIGYMHVNCAFRVNVRS